MSRKSESAIVAPKVATALTAAYASGWSYDIDVGEFTKVALLLGFVYSSITSLEILIARSDDGVTYYDDQRSSYTTGLFEDDELSKALAASENVALLIDTVDARYIRVQAKRTGGSAADTLACRAVGGN